MQIEHVIYLVASAAAAGHWTSIAAAVGIIAR